MPVIVGTTTPLERGKTIVTVTATTVTATTDFTGTYADCAAGVPLPGSTLDLGTEWPFDLPVTEAKVVELDGGAGRIDVTASASIADATYSTAAIAEPVYEIEWNELQKPVEAHRLCGALKTDRPKYKDGAVSAEGKQRTWDDWQELDDDDYDDTGDGIWALADYKLIKENGQDSYVVYAPVVRRTTVHLGRPLDVGDYSGKSQTPPGAAGFSRVEDFEWLGGPDRVTRNERRYTRTTEWAGAEYWEQLVYPD